MNHGARSHENPVAEPIEDRTVRSGGAAAAASANAIASATASSATVSPAAMDTSTDEVDDDSKRRATGLKYT